jgi:hypothetical protein
MFFIAPPRANTTGAWVLLCCSPCAYDSQQAAEAMNASIMGGWAGHVSQFKGYSMRCSPIHCCQECLASTAQSQTCEGLVLKLMQFNAGQANRRRRKQQLVTEAESP